MDELNFLKTFIEDCKYYDPDKIEIKTILENVNLKNKVVLDIGSGIGRLSFPLAKYSKKIIALDKDYRFEEYFRQKRKDNVVFINQSVEKYLAKNKKFDIILLAWPTINYKFLELIKRSMDEDSQFIFITCDNNSDFETIVDKIGVFDKNYFEKDINNKEKFLKILPKMFKVIKSTKINTRYVYPNEKIAFKIIKNSINLWFKIRLDQKAEIKLKQLINKHKKGKKVIFKEKIFFYILKIK